MSARPRPAPPSALRLLFALLALLLAGAGVGAELPQVHRLRRRCGERARRRPQEAALTAKLDALQKATGRQLVVATVPSLQGYTIEDYGYRLGRAWGVGLKGLDNGAILLVAPNERKVRVEVGYGLTPVLTDVYSTLLIQNRILPAFKAGDLPGGIAAGADALIEQLSLPDAQAKAKLDAAVAEHDRAQQRQRRLPARARFLGHRRRLRDPLDAARRRRRRRWRRQRFRGAARLRTRR